MALQDQGTNEYWSFANNILSDEANHEVSGKNYKDWRLPTLRELILMLPQGGSIGGFSNDFYWSSTENVEDANRAYAVNFLYPSNLGTGLKSGTHYVRAVRVF